MYTIFCQAQIRVLQQATMFLQKYVFPLMYSQTWLIHPHWSPRYFWPDHKQPDQPKSTVSTAKQASSRGGFTRYFSIVFYGRRSVPVHFRPVQHLGGSRRGGLCRFDCSGKFVQNKCTLERCNRSYKCFTSSAHCLTTPIGYPSSEPRLDV